MKRSSTVILSLICLIIFVVGCNNTQSIGGKETILSLISSGKWEEAKMNLVKQEFKGIENYNEIFTYVDARNDYENEKGSGKIAYEPIVIKMNSIDLNTYYGELKDEISEFKENLTKEKTAYYEAFYAKKSEEGKEKQKDLDKLKKQEDERRQKKFNDDLTGALTNKDYEKLSLLLVFKMKDDIDSEMLYYFAESQLSRVAGDSQMMMHYLELIPITYEGKYSDLISKEKLGIQSKEKWLEAERDRIINEGKWEEIMSKVPPAIGMTASEVRDSSWGGPDKINKTTYEFGVHEQWVYSNYRYVYLEDGIVTTIQE